MSQTPNRQIDGNQDKHEGDGEDFRPQVDPVQARFIRILKLTARQNRHFQRVHRSPYCTIAGQQLDYMAHLASEAADMPSALAAARTYVEGQSNIWGAGNAGTGGSLLRLSANSILNAWDTIVWLANSAPTPKPQRERPRSLWAKKLERRKRRRRAGK